MYWRLHILYAIIRKETCHRLYLEINLHLWASVWCYIVVKPCWKNRHYTAHANSRPRETISLLVNSSSRHFRKASACLTTFLLANIIPNVSKSTYLVSLNEHRPALLYVCLGSVLHFCLQQPFFMPFVLHLKQVYIGTYKIPNIEPYEHNVKKKCYSESDRTSCRS